MVAPRAIPAGLVLALFAGAPLAALQTDPAAALDEYVARAVAEWEVPGLSLAVVHGGRVVLARGYGVRALGAPDVVDEHTLFSIGSTTKAMTAATLGTLVDEGRLGWDDRVTEHLPAFRLSDPWATREVTVRDLLTHRAGLGNADGLWYGSDRTRAEILARVPEIPMAYSMRSGFVYQNIMYVAAGELAAAVAGRPWEELVAERIFAPLGMARTVPTTSIAERVENVARPHAEVDGALVEIENEVLDSVAPAGAVWSSAADMARWLSMLLDGGRAGQTRVLAEETVAELLRPQTLLRGSPYPYLHLLEPHWTSYGLGWFQLDYRGRAVCFHTGSIDGMSAIAALVPEEGLGLVVLANRDHAELRHAILWRAVDLYLGVPDGRDWSAELRSLYAAQAQRAEARRAAQRERRLPDTLPSLPPERYAGRYTHPLYGDVTVTAGAHGLRYASGPRRSGALEHWHLDTFLVRWDRRWQGEAAITFQLGADGEPARLELGGVAYERVREGAADGEGE